MTMQNKSKQNKARKQFQRMQWNNIRFHRGARNTVPWLKPDAKIVLSNEYDVRRKIHDNAQQNIRRGKLEGKERNGT